MPLHRLHRCIRRMPAAVGQSIRPGSPLLTKNRGDLKLDESCISNPRSEIFDWTYARFMQSNLILRISDLRCRIRPISISSRFANFLAFCLWFALLFSHAAAAQSQVSWTFAGPSSSADRIVALAVDPRNDSVIYAAAPGGGIWKTQDAGITWAPVFDSQPSL